MNVTAQWKSLHQQEKVARSSGRWGEAKNLQAQIVALKPRLQGHVTEKAKTAAARPAAAKGRACATVTTDEPLAFNFYLYPATQRAAVLVDRVFHRWLSSGHTFYRPLSAEVLREYRKILEVVTANLLRATVQDNRAGVRIRREERMYRQSSRYRPEVFDKKTLTILDDVHSMNLAQQIKGETWKKNPFDRSKVVDKDYRQTCLIPSTLLHTLIDELYANDAPPSLLDYAEQTEGQEIVILKRDESSSLVEYDDDATTVKYRAQVRLINEMLENAGSLLAPEVPPSLGIDQRQRFLVRRFTYGSLTSGGRLWGGFWMGLKREQRPAMLRINGEPTAEVDYQSLIARLAYSFINEGQEEMIQAPAGDLYTIPGLSPESRAGVKKLLGALLFDKHKNRDRFPKGAADLFAVEDQRKGFWYVVEKIKAHHPSLVSLFGTGIGHYLQFLESKLLVNVMLRLHSKEITALPIHDCLIVEASKSERAKAIMELTGWEVLRGQFPAVVKDGRA